MIVVDASAAVAFLTDGDQIGQFVGTTIVANEIAYPSLMPFEAAHVLRRLRVNELVDESLAQRALHAVAGFGGQVFEFQELAGRIWQLRHNLTAYDAAYVALAELIDAPLLTLDARLIAAPGTRCRFVDLPKLG